jgi:IclR family transcriptional regulator, pca regulon regulatory protein
VIQSLVKGLAVLSLFDKVHPEWTLDEIAEAVGVPRMTAYRLAKTMERVGYLVSDHGNRYHLGPAVLASTCASVDRYAGLVKVARPYLEELAAVTQETVTFAMEIDGVPVEVDEILTSRPFARPHAIGRIFGHNNTAHGKVFMASKSTAERQEIQFEVSTPHSIADEQALSAELEQVARDGIAYNCEERDIGICAVAAPVRDQAGRVVASIAVLAPPGRFMPTTDREAFATAVKLTADELSAFLGYLAPARMDWDATATDQKS